MSIWPKKNIINEYLGSLLVKKIKNKYLTCIVKIKIRKKVINIVKVLFIKRDFQYKKIN
jgi:hypothetical protein